MINKLTVIGAGLIGGSLIHALRARAAVKKVTVVARNPQKLADAVKTMVIDRVETQLEPAVAGCDIIVISTPPALIADFVAQIKPLLAKNTVVSDVGSIKGEIVKQIETKLGRVPNWFVPGHPIAGTEYSGFEAALPELFVNRKVILTPLANTDENAVAKVKSMWEAVGAKVNNMHVRRHDKVLAATSHLPHVLAYALVNMLSEMDEVENIFEFAAGGFRDFSRIASSDPVMWRDICLGNREAVNTAIDGYIKTLTRIKKLMTGKKDKDLYDFFARAKKSRDGLF